MSLMERDTRSLAQRVEDLLNSDEWKAFTVFMARLRGENVKPVEAGQAETETKAKEQKRLGKV
jgi:hypothetical protein